MKTKIKTSFFILDLYYCEPPYPIGCHLPICQVIEIKLKFMDKVGLPTRHYTWGHLCEGASGQKLVANRKGLHETDNCNHNRCKKHSPWACLKLFLKIILENFNRYRWTHGVTELLPGQMTNGIPLP